MLGGVADTFGRLDKNIRCASGTAFIADHPGLKKTRQKNRKSDPVDQKGRPGTDARDQVTGNHGTNKPGKIEYRRIHRHRRGNMLRFHQIGHHRQPGSSIECPDNTDKQRQPNQPPDIEKPAKS